MTNEGRLIIFSAPSGCGKGTMLVEILKDDRFYCSVSATTRQPREGEVDGVNYHFLTTESFKQKIDEDAFLEYARYCDNYYGTLTSEVDDRLKAGINVILEIEVQGAMKVMEKRRDALSVFIVPPSVGELRRRLNKRGTETQEVIDKRVKAALDELPYAANYDYIIVNDALEDAVDDFFAVIRAEQLKKSVQSKFIDEVIENA